jgi:amidase
MNVSANTTDVRGLGAVGIAALVNAGTLRPTDVVEATLRRIDLDDRGLRAFRQPWPEQARMAARDVEQALAAGRRLPLAGVPLGVKASEGLGSVQARRLVAAGCIPVGATSVPRGTSWQTWGYTDRGPTANPWRPDRTPGGSSAGSAAAVAAGLVPLATGNDGAGSLRIPAAWCGIVGVKLTNGLMPARDRAQLNASGPLARTVADAAAYLDAVLGTGLLSNASAGPLLPVRAIWSSTLGYADTDPALAAVARAAADRLVTAGVLQWIDHDVLLHDPQGAWHALRQGLPASAAPLRIHNDRQLAAAFALADVIITPTTPVSAHGHDGPGDAMSVSLTWAFNLSGHPAISVPAGLGADGVPVGMQIIGRHHHEATLIQIAAAAKQPAQVPV